MVCVFCQLLKEFVHPSSIDRTCKNYIDDPICSNPAAHSMRYIQWLLNVIGYDIIDVLFGFEYWFFLIHGQVLAPLERGAVI